MAKYGNVLGWGETQQSRSGWGPHTSHSGHRQFVTELTLGAPGLTRG